MNWRHRPPQVGDYETEEEYEEALDLFYDALEVDYEDKKNRD
jgi:hypothetical protein